MDYFTNRGIIARYFNLKEEQLGNFVIAEYKRQQGIVRHFGIKIKTTYKNNSFIDLNLGQFAETQKSCKIFDALVGCNKHHTLAENCANEARFVWDNKKLFTNFFWYTCNNKILPSYKQIFFASKEFFSRKFNIPLELMFPVKIKYIAGESIGYYINDEKHIIIDIAKAQAITNKECLYFATSEFFVHRNTFGTDDLNISLNELKNTYLSRWAF